MKIPEKINASTFRFILFHSMMNMIFLLFNSIIQMYYCKIVIYTDRDWDILFVIMKITPKHARNEYDQHNFFSKILFHSIQKNILLHFFYFKIYLNHAPTFQDRILLETIQYWFIINSIETFVFVPFGRICFSFGFVAVNVFLLVQWSSNMNNWSKKKKKTILMISLRKKQINNGSVKWFFILKNKPKPKHVFFYQSLINLLFKNIKIKFIKKAKG